MTYSDLACYQTDSPKSSHNALYIPHIGQDAPAYAQKNRLRTEVRDRERCSLRPACQAAGVHYDTFCDWRRRDPAFALQIDQAAARGAVKRLKKIENRGEEGHWRALAWMIERRYPAEFFKPEVQLNVTQTNLNAEGANGSAAFSAVVVSDLEFVGLRRRPDYRRRRPFFRGNYKQPGPKCSWAISASRAKKRTAWPELFSRFKNPNTRNQSNA